MIKFVTVCTLLSVALHVLPFPSAIDSYARINTVGFSARLCLSGLRFDGNVSFDGVSGDYGNMQQSRPGAILHPSSASDIAMLLKAVSGRAEGCRGLKVAARGNGHSIRGQAQVPDGHIVVEMRALSQSNPIRVTKGKEGVGSSPAYADVSGGHLWSEVLLTAVKERLSPVSWTDFLDLTVGGTLSNAGVSGQTSRYGPQIGNVLSLQVVTGKGEVEVCSRKKNPELFKAVLGGLGQFGIITSARIRLQKAPSRVTWIRSLYDDVSKFTKDQESLVSNDVAGVDYVEGFVVARNDKDPINGWRSVLPQALVDVLLLHTDHLLSSTTPILYCLEVAKYYYDDDDQIIEQDNKMDSLVSSLGHIPSLVFSEDIAYPDFLSRVKLEEEIKDEFGNEVKVPHPWINLFVPAPSILDFDSVVFKHYLKDGVGGPIILYPLNLSKWDNEMSAVVPNHEVFYMVAVLRSASFESPSLQDIMEQNKEILNFSLGSRIGAKQYLAYNENEEEWKRHYGSKWSSILRRKAMFDPLHILSPGQKVFFKQFDTF